MGTATVPKSAIGDKEIAGQLLESTKACSTALVLAAMESATPQLRRIFVDELNACLNEQDEVFRYVHQKGWYQPFMDPTEMAQQDFREAHKTLRPQ